MDERRIAESQNEAGQRVPPVLRHQPARDTQRDARLEVWSSIRRTDRWRQPGGCSRMWGAYTCC